MKLSANTVNMLKNFASINPSIVIKDGCVISTIAPSKTIIARATITETFPTVVPIYNLNRFLNSLSNHEDPELEFGEKLVRIHDSNSYSDYHYADASVITVPPDKDIKLPSVDVTFKLTNKTVQKVVKAMGVLGLPEIAVVGNGTRIFLQAVDSKNSSADTFSIEVGETDKVFKAVFKSENIRIMEGDYSVEISSKMISKFTGVDVTYWIAVEATSVF